MNRRTMVVSALLVCAACLTARGALALTVRRGHVCANSPEYRQLDFWVGEWEVRNSPGRAGAGEGIASSSVRRIIDSCVVYENYSEGEEFLGKSFNFYDAALRKWRQTWVDNSGRVSEFTGEYRDGAMRFEGESHLPDGSKVLRHMTLFNLAPDRVRQLSEASKDGGKTWQVTYDFTYVRKTKFEGTSHPNRRAAVNKRQSTRAAPGSLTAGDRAAIRALDETFVRGWLADDRDAVLSVFARDAVLFPPGSKPVRGAEAIRSYWWPDDGSRTRITSFERDVDEIEGTRRLAFLRGTASLSWVYEKDGRKTSQTSRSIDLLLLARDPAGRWRVIRQMWSVLPN